MVDDDTKTRLARDFLAGVVDGDFERMRSALQANATWSVPGHTGISGDAVGADAIVERARAIHAGGVTIELQHLLLGWRDVAVVLHNTGQRGDVPLDEVVVIVFTLAEDKIAAAANLISDVPGLDAFFAAAH